MNMLWANSIRWNATSMSLARVALPAGLALSSQHAFQIAGRAWAIWLVVWLLLAFFSKSTKRRETPGQRLQHVIPALFGFLLIFREGTAAPFAPQNVTQGKPWLMRAIFPDNPVLMLVCVVVTVLGLLFAVWARLALGSNWSGAVTIKADHQLIRRGPYRFIRHPIYTGMLTALLVTAITQRLVTGLLGFAIVFFVLWRKAKREESFLAQEFGAAFVEHRQHTGMFLPRFS
jgi:protein-S-isoprenylcysteine O-methyltransferase Ste14